jgi:hypothetical protein
MGVGVELAADELGECGSLFAAQRVESQDASGWMPYVIGGLVRKGRVGERGGVSP